MKTLVILMVACLGLVDAEEPELYFPPFPDHYATLNVTISAAPSTIKRSFRRLGAMYHPDHNKAEGASDIFKELSEAYSVLSDPVLRERYDVLYRDFEDDVEDAKANEATEKPNEQMQEAEAQEFNVHMSGNANPEPEENFNEQTPEEKFNEQTPEENFNQQTPEEKSDEQTREEKSDKQTREDESNQRTPDYVLRRTANIPADIIFNEELLDNVLRVLASDDFENSDSTYYDVPETYTNALKTTFESETTYWYTADKEEPETTYSYSPGTLYKEEPETTDSYRPATYSYYYADEPETTYLSLPDNYSYYTDEPDVIYYYKDEFNTNFYQNEGTTYSSS